jgi:hypothetical protein
MTQLAEAPTLESAFYSQGETAAKLGLRPEQVHELAAKHRQLAEFGTFGQWRYRRNQVDRLSKHPSLYRHLFPEKVFTLDDVEAVLSNHCGGMTLGRLAEMLEAVEPSEEIPDERLVQARALLKAAYEAGAEMVKNLEGALKALSD